MSAPRSIKVLDTVSVSTWTEEEAYLHLKATFDDAFNGRLELCEPYLPALMDAVTDEQRTQVMRCALRETINQRHPMPGWR